MPLNPDNHHRRSIRLQGYDYTQEGAYFVTICSFMRDCLFGEINELGVMVANPFGKVVEEEWLQTAVLRPYVELDAFVLMPSHIHAIIVITGESNVVVGAQRAAPLHPPRSSHTFAKVAAGSLGAVIRSFKSAVTKRVNELRNTPGELVWQRNYAKKLLRTDYPK